MNSKQNSPSEALVRHRKEASRMKKEDVLRAVQDLVDEESEINISAVARRAGVSREFVHTHTELHAAVTRAAQLQRDANSATGTHRKRLEQGFRSDRATLFDVVQRQKTQLKDQAAQLIAFEKQRQRWLGSQLASMDLVSPQEHAELRITNERLMDDALLLRAQVGDLQRLVATLESELAASRQAHREDVLRLSTETGTRPVPVGLAPRTRNLTKPR